MIYNGKFTISNEDLEYYTSLLELDFYEDEEEMAELEAKEDDVIGIASVKFSNGNYITIDLCSGSSNYYDNIVLFDKNGNELYAPDCFYAINSFEIDYGNDIYKVEMEII